MVWIADKCFTGWIHFNYCNNKMTNSWKDRGEYLNYLLWRRKWRWCTWSETLPPSLCSETKSQRAQAGGTQGETKDKGRGDGWWVDGGSSSVKSPHSRKWNQFPPGFPEAVPHESSSSPAACIHKAEDGRADKPMTFDREGEKERA